MRAVRVQLNWHRVPGRTELVQGSSRKEECNGHQVWDYENDKTNLHADWSVVRPRGPRA